MRLIAADDEPLMLAALTDALHEAFPEAETESFDDPENAYIYAAENDVDIAFLDIRMYGISGIELAKKIKLVKPLTNIIFCTGYSEYALEAINLGASGYIMKPATKEKVLEAIKNLHHPLPEKRQNRLTVRSFGNFEVYADGKPLGFRLNKTKELLAYLFDRQGAMCTNNEIMCVLFEDDEHSVYLRRLKADLTETLEQVGCGGALVKQWGKLGLNMALVDSDYNDWLAGRPEAINAYRGEYMSQYSWAEFTNAEIIEALT